MHSFTFSTSHIKENEIGGIHVNNIFNPVYLKYYNFDM